MVLAIVLTLMLVAYQKHVVRKTGSVAIDGGDPNLSAGERLYLQAYLTARVEDLEQPAGSNPNPATFQITPGERADQIAAKGTIHKNTAARRKARLAAEVERLLG